MYKISITCSFFQLLKDLQKQIEIRQSFFIIEHFIVKIGSINNNCTTNNEVCLSLYQLSALQIDESITVHPGVDVSGARDMHHGSGKVAHGLMRGNHII